MLARMNDELQRAPYRRSTRYGSNLGVCSAYQDLVTNHYDSFVKLANQLVEDQGLSWCTY